MINNFLDEIIQGNDGLIRKIELISLSSASIVISAMKKSSMEWINVTFHLTELSEFSIKQKARTSNVVLSNGIAYKEIDGMHFIDFSPYSELMDDISDFRVSDIYFSAKNITFEILE